MSRGSVLLTAEDCRLAGLDLELLAHSRYLFVNNNSSRQLDTVLLVQADNCISAVFTAPAMLMILQLCLVWRYSC